MKRAGFGVQSSGLAVQPDGPGVQRADFAVQRAGLGAQRSGLAVLRDGLGVQHADLAVQRDGLGVQRADLAVQRAGPRQPVGLQDSSRGLSVAMPPDPKGNCILTLKGSQSGVAPFQGANPLIRFPGVCATRATPGYFLATLRVANPFD